MTKIEEKMSREEMTSRIQSITLDEVGMAYSGKPGCACGCRGNYYHTAKDFVSLSKDHQSYSKVNESQVKRVYNIVMEHAAETEWHGEGSRPWAAYHTETRVYVIYGYESK